MGVGQELLNKYKNSIANENIEITIHKREEKIMTKSEQIAAIAAELTEEESRQLGSMLLKRADNMRAEAAEKAREEFIKAYQKYRGLAPTATHFVTVETDDYDVDIDLYEYMDDYL
jgi:hypothetical protein